MDFLTAGTLWHRARTTWQRALASGALEPLVTEVEEVEEGGARFQVRVVSSLLAKATAGAAPLKKDPFALPWEADLVVGDVSATHGCLLNKFPVFQHHLLLVTRAFEPQEAWLTRADGEALRFCLGEGGDALGFFNGGAGAGASQPHKHLQVVPMKAPLEPLLRSGRLPVRHRLVDTPKDGASLAVEVTKALTDLRVAPGAPWNLLATRDWLLVVPRRAEAWADLSVNALGFAGSLLVKTRGQLERVRDVGPMKVLRAVGQPGAEAS
ncbi:MAG: phosphorylase [Myxococcales bacterium]|nr:phosphorylase [Myxococcales bacterium]